MEDSVWEQNLFHFKPEAFNWEHLSVGKSFILKEGNFILKVLPPEFPLIIHQI